MEDHVLPKLARKTPPPSRPTGQKPQEYRASSHGTRQGACLVRRKPKSQNSGEPKRTLTATTMAPPVKTGKATRPAMRRKRNRAAMLRPAPAQTTRKADRSAFRAIPPPPTAPSFLNHHFFANEGGRNPWHGTLVCEASNPGPANPGTLCLPDSKRHKTGPKVHVPVKYKPDGEVGRIRRSTITPKDSTDRIRYRWQATAPGRIRCASQDLITPAIALQSWFRKHHQLLTDDCKEELARELYKRSFGDEPRKLHGGTPRLPHLPHPLS